MRSDLISINQQIIQANDSLNLNYNPLCMLFSLQKYEADTTSIKIRDYTIQDERDIKPMIVLPTDTEVKRVKASERNFSFDLALALLKYTESGLQSLSAISNVTPKVIKKMNIEFDKMAFTGWKANSGLLTNKNTVKVGTATDVTDLNSFIEALETTKQTMINTLKVTGADIIYLIAGSKLQLMLAKGDQGLKMTGKEWLTNNVGSNWKEIPSFILEEDAIIAFNPEACVLHYAALPQVYNTGVNAEENYRYTTYAVSSGAVDIKEKGGAVVLNVNVK